ncbi:MAG: AAA family ATPase, partial [bacterium]|nr:AAA family ATPase [bacterium]
MSTYYDIHYQDRFEEFFKGTWIYERPTGEKNKYLVLTFNFSLVDPDPKKIETSFLHHVRGRAHSFLRKYAEYFIEDREYADKIIEESNSAPDILSTVIDLCRDSGLKFYVIIDEYDNFSNTLLSTVGQSAYKDLTHGAGFFRAFFNVLKGGATHTGAPVTRIFITGVSPITMDDVTSGYNIGKHVSMGPGFNRMLGFTRRDVTEMIDYYRSKGLIGQPTGGLLQIMTQWYGNYLFCEDGDSRMYNSDMVLYFIDNYFTKKKIPKDFIDRNVRIDYGKLRHLIIVDRAKKTKKPATNGNFSKLKEIIEEGGTSAKIADGFPLEKLTDTQNFKSLLFYLGLLTIKGPERDKLRLEIPNETVRRLYYDYIEEAYRETDIFALDLSEYSNLMADMAYDGKWKPLFEFLTGEMRESMSLRDLITGEKSIQAFLNVYLGLSDLYMVHCEKELNKGFPDIVLEPFLARYEGIGYSYIIEIKYLKTGVKPGEPGDGNKKILELKEKAEKQLKSYGIDKKFKKNIEKTRLIKLVLIFSGHEAIYIGEPEE